MSPCPENGSFCPVSTAGPSVALPLFTGPGLACPMVDARPPPGCSLFPSSPLLRCGLLKGRKHFCVPNWMGVGRPSPAGLVPVRPERGGRRFRPLSAAPTKALLKQRFSLAQRFIFQAALLHDSVSGPQPGGLVLEIPAEEASGPWPDLPPSPIKDSSPCTPS